MAKAEGVIVLVHPHPAGRTVEDRMGTRTSAIGILLAGTGTQVDGTETEGRTTIEEAEVVVPPMMTVRRSALRVSSSNEPGL